MLRLEILFLQKPINLNLHRFAQPRVRSRGFTITENRTEPVRDYLQLSYALLNLQSEHALTSRDTKCPDQICFECVDKQGITNERALEVIHANWNIFP